MNGIQFLFYVVNSLKNGKKQFEQIAAKIEQHKTNIIDYINTLPEAYQTLQKITNLPKVLDARILIVDDNEAIIEILTEVLKDIAAVDTAPNGKVALDLVAKRYYDFILTDYQPHKVPNLSPSLQETLEKTCKRQIIPEEILYYIYAIFCSNIYRKTYADFLRIDFSRVPFTADYDLFIEMGKFGKELADLHLLKSPALDLPIAKYQGSGDNDRIEKVTYKEDEQRIYINKEKYFEGIAPEVWNYHIGGYQVLHKYLKDRKGRMMDDAPRYCRIVTALSKTIAIQKQIDEIYPDIEKNLIEF